MYYYFAFFLSDSLWLALHLVSPILLAVLTGVHSYGAWQKAVLLYFLGLANVHYYVRWSQIKRGAPAGRSTVERDPLWSKRRKVYVLTPGKTWARKDRS
ncbi:hypothetical protein HRbin36_00122 [bacterium HR36]|nr:hypothetical protein HRbin36_00122 [bacterium HR36]